jgi:DNA-binding IclR family transcriptional regulator
MVRDIDRERVIVAKLVLEILREFGTGYLRTARFGTHADELILLAALVVGPTSTAKLAEYAGVARPSAIRKLDSMVRRGIVEKVDGRYVLSANVANSSRVLRAADAARKRIRRAAAAMADQ